MIPTIDIAPLSEPGPARAETVATIHRACREIGFLSIVGSGVSPALIEEMRATVRAIFDVAESAKWAQAITRNDYRGYIPLGFFTPNGTTARPDRYEGFKLHRETAPDDPIRQVCDLYGPNRWPAGVPGAHDVILRYWAEMDRVTAVLLGALEEALALPAGRLTGAFTAPLTNMTLLHYPPQPPEEAGYGIHPHKDTDALTIIAPDPVGGLEVKSSSGKWLTPDCPPGGFVVNIGDMLELWSGGRLVSTPHRVVNSGGRERYSFPYFAVPRYDVTVAPQLPPVAGFERPAVHCGHWSAEVWRTNWPDETITGETPELGTLPD